MKYILDCNHEEVLIRSIINFNGSGTTALKDEVKDWLDDNITGWEYNGVIELAGKYNEGLEFEFLTEAEHKALRGR